MRRIYKKQLGFGTLVSSQERRALVVPRINRGWTAGKPRENCWFCSFIGLHRLSVVRASRDTPRRVVFDRLKGTRDGCLLGEPTRRRPVLPVSAPPRHPAVRRPVPTRSWYVRVLDSTGFQSSDSKPAISDVQSRQKRIIPHLPPSRRGSEGMPLFFFRPLPLGPILCSFFVLGVSPPSYPAPLHPAAPRLAPFPPLPSLLCAAPPRPARGMSGF